MKEIFNKIKAYHYGTEGKLCCFVNNFTYSMMIPSYCLYNQESLDGLTSSYMGINITNTNIMNGMDYILLVYYTFKGNEPIPLYPYGMIKMN